jgi:cell division protein FtsN
VVTINLDMPVQEQAQETDTLVVPPPAPVAGAPVRVVEDRANVKFDANAPAVEAPRPRPVASQQVQEPAIAPKPVATATGWMVQIGSYDSRAGAEAGQRRVQSRHNSLVSGKQFAILAAQVNGRNVFRLRVTGFATSADANSFCRNAKSDGLDCFVTR